MKKKEEAEVKATHTAMNRTKRKKRIYGTAKGPQAAATIAGRGPNQSPEPTPVTVTPRADARCAPAPVVAHL